MLCFGEAETMLEAFEFIHTRIFYVAITFFLINGPTAGSCKGPPPHRCLLGIGPLPRTATRRTCEQLGSWPQDLASGRPAGDEISPFQPAQV